MKIRILGSVPWYVGTDDLNPADLLAADIILPLYQYWHV